MAIHIGYLGVGSLFRANPTSLLIIKDLWVRFGKKHLFHFVSLVSSVSLGLVSRALQAPQGGRLAAGPLQPVKEREFALDMAVKRILHADH